MARLPIQLSTAELAFVENAGNGVLRLLETTAPSQETGYGKLYVKTSDSNLYFKDETGTETQLTGGGAGGGANTALSNLASVAINTSLISDGDGVDDLGATGLGWNDLYLSSGSIIDWNSGAMTLTHSASLLTLAGGQLQLNGGLVMNHTAIDDLGDMRFDATPASDDTWNGPSTDTFNAGATIAQFEAVYLNSSSQWVLTDADAVSTAGSVMVALAGAAGTAANPLRVILGGSFVRNDAWNWTVGGPIYLSTTAGALTQTAPSATDDVVRVVGYAVTADVIYWNPSNDWATIV